MVIHCLDHRAKQAGWELLHSRHAHARRGLCAIRGRNPGLQVAALARSSAKQAGELHNDSLIAVGLFLLKQPFDIFAFLN